MSGLINHASVVASNNKEETTEMKLDGMIDYYNKNGAIGIRCSILLVSAENFLELYGNGLIKNQQVKGGHYSGIYKGIKIEAKS